MRPAAPQDHPPGWFAGLSNRLGALWLVGVVAAGAAAFGASSAMPPPVPAALPAAPVRPAPAPATAKDCMACHRFSQGLSHPVDVAPASGSNGGLPLEGGRVTCLTCHDAQSAQGHEQRTPKGESYLQSDESAPALCLRCHAQSQSTHKTAYPWAHPIPERRGASRMDQESSACMSCHDGAIAPDAGPHQDARAGQPQAPDHAVGTRFTTQRFSEVTLVPTARLDPRIQLFDGKLGCGSCHSVYAPRASKLVITNHASQLCLTCHVE